jgi:KUP system potassium uptake protein
MAKPAHASESSASASGNPAILAVSALGVVYGDLGTSPLYTLQTVMGALGGALTQEVALGALSLILWTLVITISVKYCALVMRADNHGEGGILALMSLIGVTGWKRRSYLGATMGLLGAALIYGDGIITPAISVLSALEGLTIATSAVKPYILPATVGILLALFTAQRFGTATIGRAFGPIMLVWFVTIAVIGGWGVIQHPVVIGALNPWLGLKLLGTHSGSAIGILGGVFLCATGGEALYADMGHFGPTPIRRSWYFLVLPSLFLSYAGQIGNLLDTHNATANPFFAAAPAWALYPLVALATAATIIASQAIITGSFSMTRQAIQLGWLPPLNIRQTSDTVYGQIYVPVINVLLALGTIAMTLAFRSSDRLAGAYGTAVSTTMVLTTLLLSRAMVRKWRWSLAAVIPTVAVLLVVDVSFFAANLAKVAAGGWVPLTLGLLIFGLMINWRSSLQKLQLRFGSRGMSAASFHTLLAEHGIVRAPGMGVYLVNSAQPVPAFMVQYVRRMGSLHEVAIAVHIIFEQTPRIDAAERAKVEELGDGLWRVELHYGFIEIPNVSRDLESLDGLGHVFKPGKAVYFASRSLLDTHSSNLWHKFRCGLFSLLYRNAARTSDRFVTPIDRTMDITRHVKL